MPPGVVCLLPSRSEYGAVGRLLRGGHCFRLLFALRCMLFLPIGLNQAQSDMALQSSSQNALAVLIEVILLSIEESTASLQLGHCSGASAAPTSTRQHPTGVGSTLK